MLQSREPVICEECFVIIPHKSGDIQTSFVFYKKSRTFFAWFAKSDQLHVLVSPSAAAPMSLTNRCRVSPGKGWIVIEEIRKCKFATKLLEEERPKFQRLKHLLCDSSATDTE